MLPDDGRMVRNFIVQALRGEALTLYSDESQILSFCLWMTNRGDDSLDG